MVRSSGSIYSQNRLREERIRRFEETQIDDIPWWYNDSDRDFIQKVAEIKQYILEHGELPPKRINPLLVNVKPKYRKGLLPPWRTKLLDDELGSDWADRLEAKHN